MTKPDTTVIHPGPSLQQELDDLRDNLLSLLAPVSLFFAWLWVLGSAIARGSISLQLVAPVALGAAALLAYSLRNRARMVAFAILLAGYALAVALAVWGAGEARIIAYGVVVAILAHAVVGMRAAALVTVLTWALANLAWSYRQGVVWSWEATDLLGLYALTWSVAWLAARPLRTSVVWALSAWQYANDALTETRERRAEVYRTLRALEEATYRIERMNNELIVARGEAEQARALKARFASMVSHELRNPLSLILGFSRLMALSPERYGASLPDPYREDVEAIYRSSRHIVTLVDDILDLSQIEAQRMALVKDQIDLESDVVAKAAEIIRPLALRKGLYLRLELDGSLPPLLADAVRLRQALLNLLTNAVRLTDKGGIVVRTALAGRQAVVSVQDTGPGIAPQDMPKLFREFSSLSAGAAQPEVGDKGSGLGLSICKHLIELHGGRIEATSRPGAGTTFSFALPLEAAEEATISVDASRRPRALAKDSCLIVHDDPGMVRLLARYLDHYHVVGLPTTHAVLPLVRDLHPRAIIAAPEMARAIGRELDDTIFDVPIITCGIPRLQDRSALPGVLGYLIKPISAEAVAAVMRQVPSNGSVTVLVVDDDPDAVRLLEGLLLTIPHPYRVVKATDGAQALEQMRAAPPDVVLMDLLMPTMDGREVLRRMREDERLAGVPVVIVSAQDWTEDTQCLGRTLQVRYRRPVTLEQSAHCLRGLLDSVHPHYLEDPITP